MTLEYTVNPFNGAVISGEPENDDPAAFIGLLTATLEEIHDQGLELAWLYLPPSHARIVPGVVDLGFHYHHADENGLQLVYRVNPEAFVPGYATHFIGVGGVVVDAKRRLLVIQERHHIRKHYKLPGGALEPGEHLSDAVIREVLEETGIRCRFLSLHCFRHWHGYRHGKSDIYFVCRLEPLSSAITPDSREISECRWMPMEEYLENPDTHPFNRKIVETALHTKGLRIDTIPDYGTPETHEMMFATS